MQREKTQVQEVRRYAAVDQIQIRPSNPWTNDPGLVWKGDLQNNKGPIVREGGGLEEDLR